MEGKEKDIALASDDVLLVPTQGFKAGLSLGGASVATGAVDALIYRVP
jgi:hypothetical protein